MLDMKSDYGQEIRRFFFDAIYPGKDTAQKNVNFIIYEKGLYIKGASLAESFHAIWRETEFSFILEEDDFKVIVTIKGMKRGIEAGSKNRAREVETFYDLVVYQKEKHRYYDDLMELEVDLDEISIAMNCFDSDQRVYLDTKTGSIIYIPNELDEDNIYDEGYILSLPEWEREMADEVRTVYEDLTDRYLLIPERYSADSYQIMIDFTKKLDDFDISMELFEALDGRGAFRRFRNVLKRYPKVEEQWYTYKESAEKNDAKEWLWQRGIDPVESKKNQTIKE